MKRDFFDFDSYFYKPIWVRALILAVCFGWGFFELSNQNYLWSAIFLGAGAYCIWGFFIRKGDD